MKEYYLRVEGSIKPSLDFCGTVFWGLVVWILRGDFFLVGVQQLAEISKLRGLRFSAVLWGKLRFTECRFFEIISLLSSSLKTQPSLYVFAAPFISTCISTISSQFSRNIFNRIEWQVYEPIFFFVISHRSANR